MSIEKIDDFAGALALIGVIAILIAIGFGIGRTSQCQSMAHDLRLVNKAEVVDTLHALDYCTEVH